MNFEDETKVGKKAKKEAFGQEIERLQKELDTALRCISFRFTKRDFDSKQTSVTEAELFIELIKALVGFIELDRTSWNLMTLIVLAKVLKQNASDGHEAVSLDSDERYLLDEMISEVQEFLSKDQKEE